MQKKAQRKCSMGLETLKYTQFFFYTFLVLFCSFFFFFFFLIHLLIKNTIEGLLDYINRTAKIRTIKTILATHLPLEK